MLTTTPFGLRLTSLPLPLVPRLCPQRSQRKSLGRKMYALDMEHSGTLRRTPPLPRRNPLRRVSDYDKPPPPLPDGSFRIELELLPQPLFSRRMTLPPSDIQVAAVELTSPAPSPIIRPSDSASSSASSIRSWEDSIAPSPTTTPATSAPNSPASRTRSLTFPSSPTTFIMPPPALDTSPRPSLRRKKSPRKETLRSLRAKDSDSSLKQVYDRQTSVFLENYPFELPPAKSGLRRMHTS